MPQCRSCVNWKLAISSCNPKSLFPKITFSYKKTKCILRMNSMTYKVSNCSLYYWYLGVCAEWGARNGLIFSIFFLISSGHFPSQNLQVFYRFRKEKSLSNSPILQKEVGEGNHFLNRAKPLEMNSISLAHIFNFLGQPLVLNGRANMKFSFNVDFIKIPVTTFAEEARKRGIWFTSVS